MFDDIIELSFVLFTPCAEASNFSFLDVLSAVNTNGSQSIVNDIWVTANPQFKHYQNGASVDTKDENLNRYKRQEVTHNISTYQDADHKLYRELPFLVFVETEVPGIVNPGILISENFVLIPAHLIKRNTKVTFVLIARERFTISKKIRHPMYRGKQKHFDIGLLKLENNINLQSNVLPACLWLNDEKSNAELIVARWNHREGISSLTKQTDIVVKDFESCISFFDPNILAINNISFLDHQMCIVNEMEDAMDLSGGPLYVDLVHDDHIVPFVIGIASTATRANLYEIDIFTKLSRFGNWIAETMREEGEEVSFEPLECAKRHLQYRRQINGSKLFDSSNTIDYMVSIHGNPDANQTIKCTGALIGKDVVVTLGQCVINFMPYSSYVVFDDRSTINIKNIIIHPNYTANTLYNNIAILKLVSEASITPAQIAAIHSKHNKITLYATDGSKDKHYFSVNGLSLKFSDECVLSDDHRFLLLEGLQPEHLCLQSDYALVPGSCEAHPSTVVYWERYGTKYLLGLYMAGGHCGFGEQAIGLYIYEHNLWINSVINSPSSKSREYIDPFLNLSDVCSYANGRRGTCVSQTSCPNVRQRVENNLPIFYCKNRAVVCCLSDSETQLEAENEITFAINRC
ncbi:uncharacterized protein LOC121599397 isoform X3 [Anopheles merus]|uniref:uncharacterized protein LOC121599397 isoform X3 n=1 Tax=Anopheles merus TaxID=30066 RepID=UPI001BE48A8C|nr:uncharacterized protein LOC121599397 isoform X3 [Anopheles merus]